MIQVITHCDRCNKMLDRDEGHGLQIWAKRQVETVRGSGHFMNSAPFCADICDGCRTMLDFFFVGKFKEEVQSA